MNVIGLTPIDSALSLLGLNVSSWIGDMFFHRTKLGITAFAFGFLWSVWRVSVESSIRPVAIFLIIAISGYLMFGLQVSAQNFKSKKETLNSVSISSTAIREGIVANQEIKVPQFLSFFAIYADGIIFDLIASIDAFLKEPYRFLKDPFGLQQLSLRTNSWLIAPITNQEIREHFDDYIYADYLPRLIIQKNEGQLFQAGDQVNWQSIKNLGKQDDFNRIETVFAGPAQRGSIDDQLAASFVHGQISKAPSSVIWPLSLNVFSFFPYVLGVANFILYASFPFLCVSMLIFRKSSFFYRYLEFFLMVKSWSLLSAFAHYLSLIVFKVQDLSSPNSMNWYWESPYFASIAAFVLCFLPMISFIGFKGVFHTINQQFK